MRTLTPYWTARSFGSGLFEEMDRFLNDISRVADAPIYDERTFMPAFEVTETEGHFLMGIDLPGMKRESIKIDATDKFLTISGERKNSEKPVGSFKRSFSLPVNVEISKVEARYEDGVLEVYLPKTEAHKPRQIEIQHGKSGIFEKLLGSKKSAVEPVEIKSTGS